MEELALKLVPAIRRFDPTAVVYVHRGGTVIGRALSTALGLPCHRLDIHYPLTLPLRRVPAPLATLALPLKELCYRLTEPRALDPGSKRLPGSTDRVVLVDDSASSGRTIRTALAILEDHGIPRSRIEVAVIRCGPRARRIVDHHVLDRPARFHTST